jgi:predicted nuclease of predicted toxin-antitoxin system
MKFVVDAQLPRALALRLAALGFPATHTLDLPQGNRSTDRSIASVADAENAVVITKDADFVNSHLVSNTPRRLLLVSTGNISNPALLALFENHLTAIIPALESAAFVELLPSGLIVRH